MLCLLVLLVLILFCTQTTRKLSSGIYQNIRASTTESVKTLTSDRARMLDKTLELLKVQARTLAAYLLETDFKITPAILQPFLDMNEHFIRIVAFHADGTAVSSDGAIDKLPVESDVYKQVFAGKCGVTDTFPGAMGYKEVNVYAPIYKNTQIIGGVYINLKAEALRNAGKNPLYESSGYSYILKRDGTILLAPSSYSYAQIYQNVREVFLISQSDQETVDAFMKALENGDSGNAILNFSGDMQIICFEPLLERNDWYYVSVLPLALVESNGQEVLHLSSRMISLFVIIILVFLAFLSFILFLTFRDKWKKQVNDGRVYKAISENIHTAIFIMEKHTGHIRHAFENMQNVLGIPAEKVQDCHFSREWLMRVGLPVEVAAMVARVEVSSQPATTELKHFNPALNKEVWLRIGVSPLLLKGRKEYMVAFTDITENKRLMEELRSSMLEAQSASAAKSSFLANMSHDIRTPMNAITGMTAIATANIDDKNRVLDCLRKITLSSKHLTGLINDILDMSKIESGKLSLNPDNTSLPEVLESLANITQINAKAKQQCLTIVVKHVTHESVLCDSVRLSQVLLNILSNAVKFTPEKGRIRFLMEETVSPSGAEYGRYIFRVKDSGIGMSKSFQKTIFESFTREKNRRIEKIEGSGLGMSISKWIVDQMNGTIQVISAQNEGSEFIVTLDFPLAAGKAEQNTLSGASLLLAFYDAELLESTAQTLRELDAQAEAVSDAETVFACLSSGKTYDAILADCSFPGFDPAVTPQKIQSSCTGAPPVVILSASNCSDAEEQSSLAGANAFISPPFFKSVLYQNLSHILSGKADDSLTLSPDRTLEGIRILLAEDNELNREIAIELLTCNGVIVDAVEDGRQSLARFCSSPPGYYRMILTDIQMPVMNGYESARRIRISRHPDAKTIPILAVTADAFSEDIESAKKAGMNGHISKPLDIGQLIAEMKKHC